MHDRGFEIVRSNTRAARVVCVFPIAHYLKQTLMFLCVVVENILSVGDFSFVSLSILFLSRFGIVPMGKKHGWQFADESQLR